MGETVIVEKKEKNIPENTTAITMVDIVIESGWPWLWLWLWLWQWQWQWQWLWLWRVALALAMALAHCTNQLLNFFTSSL